MKEKEIVLLVQVCPACASYRFKIQGSKVWSTRRHFVETLLQEFFDVQESQVPCEECAVHVLSPS